jgi:concanavalin A-like lectin/glucanase superfamily protein
MRRTTGSRRFLRVVGAVAIALTAMALNGCTPGPTPTADYQFNGTTKACRNLAPALTGLGTTGFATESVDGKTWKVQTFDDNSGLQLSPTANEMAPGAYTIVVLFRISAPEGFVRLIDFKNGTADTGLYSQEGYLSFYNLAAGPAATIGSTFVQVVLTRGADGTVSGYVDGAQQFTFTDTTSQAVISNDTLRFFQDNTSGGAGFEASPGAVARIRLYDKALTATEVGNLNQLPASPCSTT